MTAAETDDPSGATGDLSGATGGPSGRAGGLSGATGSPSGATGGPSRATGGPRGAAGGLSGAVEDLSGAVEDLSGTAGERLVHLPDTATALVFRTTADGRSDLMVVGPRTRAAYHAGKDLPVCVRIRLPPGAARPLLGRPVGELVDRVTPLAELWCDPGVHLERRLAGLGGDRHLVAAQMRAAVRARPPADPGRERLVRTAALALSARHPARLPELARRLSVSERHLRQLLTEDTGLAPKSYARIARLRGVLGRGRPGRLAEVAAAAGYYDQSHLTAEFRGLMGVPPGAFFTGRLPEPLPC